ncbi:MAG: Asp23/Gls24 family envelope stress response protein [Clostridia bacterium]|nr:Asp23/Gls24 family envelope stress response protein [Clostridia bacterium]
MARFKNIPVNSHEGKITYGKGIVNEIVELAVKEIANVELYTTPYKQTDKAIKVVTASDGVHVDVTVKTHYTESISEVAFKIQEAIRHNVEAMTEYRIASVNVNIKGVTFEEPSVQPVIDETANVTKEVTNEK